MINPVPAKGLQIAPFSKVPTPQVFQTIYVCELAFHKQFSKEFSLAPHHITNPFC
jgi:hypothetical protein